MKDCCQTLMSCSSVSLLILFSQLFISLLSQLDVIQFVGVGVDVHFDRGCS